MAKSSAPTRRGGRRLWKTVAIGLLIVLLVYILLSVLGSAVVFRLLFGRSELDPLNLELCYADVDDARYPRQSLRFPSGDQELQGYLYGAESRLGTVVMVHGISGGADSHLAEALWFAERGWAVFCLDGTGTRESGGSGTVGLSQMKLDLLAALRFLESERPDEPILLYGHSLGAWASAAVLDDCPAVRAAVCISAFDSPVDTMYYHAKKRVGALATVEYPFLILWNRLQFGDEADEHAADAIRRADARVLLVYGSEDETVPEEISLYARRGDLIGTNTEVLLLDAAPRNRHSTLWLSEAGAEYYLQKRAELDALRRQYGASPPDEVAAAFLADLDRVKLTEPDPEFMAQVQRFFLDAVAEKAA